MATEKAGAKEEQRAEEEEEMQEATTIKYRGWKAMPYVIGNETFEKLGTIGTSSNMLVYLTSVFHLRSATAAVLLNVVHGTTNLAPLVGAFLSDTYFGRYATLGFACVASLMGMIIITLTAAIPNLHPPKCSEGQSCLGPVPAQLAVLLLGFAFLVVGAGGIRPCNLAFGADQFDPKTESGRKGINSFFNWYYFTFTFAMMISSTLIIYIQSDISWTLGLGIPSLLMLLACVFFFIGTRIYVRLKPQGSPFTSIAQVLAAAFDKRKLKHQYGPDDLFNPPRSSNTLNSKLPYTEQFKFLDMAAIKTPNDEINRDGSAADPWRLCSLQQVEEVKCLIRIIPIWSAGIIYYTAVVQNGSYVVFQALQSDRHLGKSSFQIPAGSFTVFNMLALTIWIPIYDRIIVPRVRRVTGTEGGITMLQRIGIGMFLGIVAMVVAALVEDRRRSLADASIHGDISSMSSMWLVPQLVILGLSEAFAMIGQVEFYYKQFPESMRSVAGSLVFVSSAVANYLSGFMVTVVRQSTGHGGDGRRSWLDQDLNQGKLDCFYFLIAAMGVVNFAYFVALAKWYRYKGSVVSAEAENGLELAGNKSNGSLV